LEGLEEAPATAIRGEEKKVRAAVCMAGSVVGIACREFGGGLYGWKVLNLESDTRLGW
jgi:hypothetical protein